MFYILYDCVLTLLVYCFVYTERISTIKNKINTQPRYLRLFETNILFMVLMSKN